MVPFFLHFGHLVEVDTEKRPGGDVSSASLVPLSCLSHRLKRSTVLLTNNNMKVKVKKRNKIILHKFYSNSLIVQ